MLGPIRVLGHYSVGFSTLGEDPVFPGSVHVRLHRFCLENSQCRQQVMWLRTQDLPRCLVQADMEAE